MLKFIKRAATALAGTVILLSSGASYAQLEEIVVTATKRAASLQDVPLSITAVSGETLELMGAESLLDFAVKVPNLAMAYEADGRFDSSSPSIRGVFGVNTTGFYVDDTRVNASLLPRVVDLARVEVLRGPQGSLYGARSMGGTIRLITKQAVLDETSGSVNVQLSSVEDGGENYSFDANYNFPLIEDRVAMRVNAYYGDMSGVQDRVFQPTWVEATRGIVRQTNAPDFGRNEDVDDESYIGGQLAATIKVSETLEFRPKVMFQSVDADGLPFADIDPERTEQVRFFDIEEPGTDDWIVASGTLDWDVANGNVSSTTSYYTRETDETEEETTFLHFLYDAVIGIPIDPFASPISTIEDYESISHETRFSSDYEGPVQFTAGVYYEDLTFDHRYPAALQPGVNAALNAFIGAPADIVPGDLIFVTSTITDIEEFAVFGELNYEFNDAWSVTAGGRYYDTSVAAVNSSDGFANGGPTSFDEKQSEDGFNPKVSVQYEANENLNIYSTAAKGFRIGGVNGNVPASLCGAELATLGLDPSNATTFD